MGGPVVRDRMAGPGCTWTGSWRVTRRGSLLLHGYGDVFQRRLGVGEKILVGPGGFLYKDSPVAICPVPVQAGAGFRNANWAELTGPGRVGIQSMNVHRHII